MRVPELLAGWRKRWSLAVLHGANRVRKAVGRPVLPKRCCRNPENLLAPENASSDGKMTFRRCGVCGCRHFRWRVETGRLGVTAGR